MLIVLGYKYLIMHVHIVQSDFHFRHIPFRGITARTQPFPISWSPPPLVVCERFWHHLSCFAMNDCIAELVFMFRLWLCLALGLVAFLAVVQFTNMSERMGCAYHMFEPSKVKLRFQG